MSLIGQSYYRIVATRAGHRAARTVLSAFRSLGLAREFRLPLDALTLDPPLVRELMRLWSRLHWAGTDGMMPPRELLALVQLAYTCRAEGDTVELGSWVGLTTCYLASICRARGRGEVFAVDTFAGTMEGGQVYPSVAKYDGSTLGVFEDNVRRAGVQDLVRTHVGLTTEMAKRHAGRSIRFLLVDADHSYEGTRADFECWAPMVVTGGLIVFHDYLKTEVGDYVDTEIVGAEGIEPLPGRVVPNLFAVTKTSCRKPASDPNRAAHAAPAVPVPVG